MKFPLVRDLAAEGFPVRLTCGVLGFSSQAFYKWRARPVSDRDWADAHTTNVIVDVHADDPEFGYRFIADELEAVSACLVDHIVVCHDVTVSRGCDAVEGETSLLGRGAQRVHGRSGPEEVAGHGPAPVRV